MSKQFQYWGDGEPKLVPTVKTTGLDYWADGEPISPLVGSSIIIVELDVPPEISLAPLNTAGLEYAINLGEPPNIAMDAATVANTEIAVAVYTENILMTPLNAGAIYIVKPDTGLLTISGYDATGTIATHRTFPIPLIGRTTNESISSGERIFPVKK